MTKTRKKKNGSVGKSGRNARSTVRCSPISLCLLPLSIYPILWVIKFMFYQYDKIHDRIFIE